MCGIALCTKAAGSVAFGPTTGPAFGHPQSRTHRTGTSARRDQPETRRRRGRPRTRGLSRTEDALGEVAVRRGVGRQPTRTAGSRDGSTSVRTVRAARGAGAAASSTTSRPPPRSTRAISASARRRGRRLRIPNAITVTASSAPSRSGKLEAVRAREPRRPPARGRRRPRPRAASPGSRPCRARSGPVAGRARSANTPCRPCTGPARVPPAAGTLLPHRFAPRRVLASSVMTC